MSRRVATTIGALLLLSPAAASAADLVIPAGESSTRSGELLFETVQISGTLNVKAFDGTDESGWIYLRAHRIVIDDGARINATGKGYSAGIDGGPSEGGSPANTGAALPGGGGGHAGQGGGGRDMSCTVVVGAEGGAVSENDPSEPFAVIFATPTGRQQGMGSAGGASWAGPPNETVQRSGSNGGGVVILEAAEIEILGRIEADGADLGSGLQGTGPGGGAGGTIVIRSNALTVGPQTSLSAQGAAGGTMGETIGGGGGGGLIAIFAPGDLATFLTSQVSVAGGDPGVCTSVSSPAGAPGVTGQFPDIACIDADRDGAASARCGGADCNDGDPDIRPGAVEICNGIDDDCNGVDDDDDSPDLCPEGSGLVCIAGTCDTDPAATTGAGGGAFAVPEVELAGGLCSAARGLRGGPTGVWPLAGLLVAAAVRRRASARSRDASADRR